MPFNLEIVPEDRRAEVSAMLDSVREASFGELNVADLRMKLQTALKAKIRQEQGIEEGCYCGGYYIEDVFQTFFVHYEYGDSSNGYKSRFFKRNYTVSGSEVTVGDKGIEVELAWVKAMSDALEAALDPQAAAEVQQARETSVFERTPLGEPSREAISCDAPVERMRETVSCFEITEASFDEPNLLKGIVPITPGLSVNKSYYATEVIKRDVSVFNGLPVFYDHQDSKLGKPLKNLIGVLENARWDDDNGKPLADMRYPDTAKEAIADIKEKHKLLGGDRVGFSIDMPVKARLATLDGQMVKSVEALLGGGSSSTDVVFRPSAGGGFGNALESTLENEMPKELKDMTAAEILAARPDLRAVEASGDANTDPAAKTDAAIEASGAKAPVSQGQAVEYVTREAAQSMVQDAIALASREMAFRSRVNGMNGLSEKIKTAIVREAAESGFDLAKADDIIKGWANEASAAAGGVDTRIIIPGRESAAIVTREPADVRMGRLLAAGLGEVQDVNGVKCQPFHSLREAVLEFHPEFMGMALKNPTQFADESFNLMHWGGGDLRRALSQHTRESIVSTTFNLAWADVMNKVLEKEMADPDVNVWRNLVSDFIPFKDLTNSHKVIRVGDYPDLDTVGEGAPYQPTTTPGQEKVEFTIGKYGNTEDFTWEAALNDDLGVLARIPRGLARAWAWTLYRSIMALFTANSGDGATCDYDSLALYDSGHSNSLNTAFTVSDLIAVCGKLHDMTDITTSNPKLYKARFLMFADTMALRQQIWEAIQSTYKVTTSVSEINLPNFVRDVLGLEPLPVYYAGTTTRWEVVADPRNVSTIAVGFLNGNDMPEIFVQDMERVGSVFNNDKITYKVRATGGCDILNHRAFGRGRK